MVGLIVLVVIITYFSIALFCIYKVKSVKNKFIVSLVFILIPTADVIVGNIYFRYLCHTQSGQFIYKTIKVSDEYYLKLGEEDTSAWIFKLDFLTKDNGQKINRDKFSHRYLFEFLRSRSSYSKFFHIFKRKDEIIDRASEKILSETIHFGYGGGWVENIYKMTGSGRVCPKDRPGLLNLAEKTFYIENE